jgi:nucleotide-binding universal stress UspA family protein
MYQRILVAVDGSSTSLTGLGEAIRLAQVTGGRLKLVHVSNVLIGAEYGMGVDANAMAASIRANASEIIDEAAAVARKSGVPFEQQIVESFGRPADEIVKVAEVWPAELIVIGTHGRRGLKRLAMGSDAELVLRLSSVPVLMIREKPEAGKVAAT